MRVHNAHAGSGGARPIPFGDGATTDRARWAAASLYDKLEHVVLPRFHAQREQFVRVMRQAIAVNASRFNTQRMVQEYVVKAYLG